MREKLLNSIYKSSSVSESQRPNLPETYKLFDMFFPNKVYCFLNNRDQETIKVIEKKPYLFNYLPTIYYSPLSIEPEREISKLLGMFNKLKKEDSILYIVSMFSTELFQKAYSVFEPQYPTNFVYYSCEDEINGDVVEEIFNSINENGYDDTKVYIDSRVLPKIRIRKPPTLEYFDD